MVVTRVPVLALKRHRVLWLTLAAFLSSAALVQPMRETALEDDWAYSLTVRHLVETGQYQLHDWLSANMPFQAYWGALFATVGGYSLGVLRVSTLVLAFIGVVAFYHLARHHDLEPDAAGVATLAFLASPLVFRYSYNFNTEVPFLSCWILSLLGYSVGIARGSLGFMLMGGAAGAAAILTRQFGVALIPAVAGVWLMDRYGRARWPLYGVGLVPLLLAGAWQGWEGVTHPNWGALTSRVAEAQYLSRPGQLLLHILWRPATVLLYLALFSLPLLPLAGMKAWDSRRQTGVSRLDGRVPVLVAMYVVGAVLLGGLVLDMPWLMPYLPWNFARVGQSRFASLGLTGLMFFGAIILGSVLYRRYRGPDRPGQPQHWLLDIASFFLLAQYLIYFKLGDQYLLPLVPLAMIALSVYARSGGPSRIGVSIVCGLVVLVGSVIWTRGTLVYQEARWQAAEWARAAGVAPASIHGPWAWIAYYRFQDYLTDIGHRVPHHLSNSVFGEWLPLQEKRADYHVVVSPAAPPPEQGEVVIGVPFRDIVFRPSHAFLVRRPAGITAP